VEALSPEVLEDLRHGRRPRANAKSPSAPAERIFLPRIHAEILAVLTHDADEMVAVRAQDAILSAPLESFVEALKREHALPALFAYAGQESWR